LGILVRRWFCGGHIFYNKHQKQGFVKIPLGVEELRDLFLLAIGGGNERFEKRFLRLILVQG